MGLNILFLYCALRDLSPTPATDTAAPRTRTSEARVTREAGEDIAKMGWKMCSGVVPLVGLIKARFCLDDLAVAMCNCGDE